MDPFARLNDEAPPAFRGLDRFVARKALVAEMEALGFLRHIEKTRHVVPHGDRSGVPIEPYLTDQWYVDAKTLAEPAIKAVEEGRTVFEPKAWEKTYFEWLRNIEPWCISRQLWWGHRIPAWYGPGKLGHLYLVDEPQVFVGETEAEAIAQARAYYGTPVKVVEGKADAQLMHARGDSFSPMPIWRDEDVLDTWFSSALWPFSTLGWPNETQDLKRFYPTSVLVTGFDIIFFWVARMMMMGIHFMGEVPFHKVFINALIRDEKGQKMSKSKGNVMDPLELIDAYGADALRFTLTAMSGQARDIKLSTQRIEGYRNFGTKLWNAARFCQMNECVSDPAFDPASAKLTVNRWIRAETAKTIAEVTEALDACAFDDVAGSLYRFIWNVFCDWHLELAKPVLNGDDEAAKAETRAMTAWVLDVCLKLLHPVMPFLTEELWDKLAEFGAARSGPLICAAWPTADPAWLDQDATDEIDLVIAAVNEGRSVRAELNVPPSARPPLHLPDVSQARRAIYEAHNAVIASTLRISELRFSPAPAGSIPFVVDGDTLVLPLAGFVDLDAEKARLNKAVTELDVDAERTRKKLSNADFVARAPEAVVEENRARLAEAETAKAKLEAALRRLEGLG